MHTYIYIHTHTYIHTYIYTHSFIYTYIYTPLPTQTERLAAEVLKIRNTTKKELLAKIREIRIPEARAILLVEILSVAYNKYSNSKSAGMYVCMYVFEYVCMFMYSRFSICVHYFVYDSICTLHLLHTYIHTYIHTHMHTYTYIHTVHLYIHTYIHTYILFPFL